MGRAWQPVWALVIFLAAALALFGGPLAHGGNQCICVGADESIPTWGFAWFPYAIEHGLNPFYSHLVYQPTGYDVALATVIPGGALLLAPVTLTAGPLAAFNLAVTLSPALAAFFAFLLCRRLVGRFWPALLGGWLFGFSTYVLGQMTTHLHMALVFPVPALVHLVLRRLAGEIPARRFVLATAGALLLQLSFAAETFASLTVFGAIALVVAYGFADPRLRGEIRALVPRLGLAYALTAVIAAPYLLYALRSGGLPLLPTRDDHFSNALLAFVVPSMLARLGGHAFLSTSRYFSAGFAEDGAYLGLPLIAMALLALLRDRGRVGTRVAGVMALLTAVCSLGGYLHVQRATSIPMPWWPFTHLPILGQMIPARFAVYTSLAVAVLAAQWLASARVTFAAWALGLLAVASLWPAVGRGYWREAKPDPALFTSARYARVIGRRDVALIVPVGPKGYSMLWQAQSGLRFSMAGGYLPPPESPNPDKRDPIYPMLSLGRPVVHVEAAAERFLIAHRVSVAVVDPQIRLAAPWTTILTRLGWAGRTIGGAIVFRPPAGWPVAVARAAGSRDRSPPRSRTPA